MRINRQTLLKIAGTTIEKRIKEDHTLIAIYLHGSLNQDADPFLGDSTDIDLVFIHEYDIKTPREIVAVTGDVTFDIIHHDRRLYQTPRELRSHPWLGPAIYNFNILHDPRHFLDFTQASLRDQFFAPSNVFNRAQTLAGDARQAWMTLLATGSDSPGTALQFLQAAADSANAIASLDGDPLTERRLLTQFFERTDQMGQPAFYTGLLEILGAGEMSADDLTHWTAAWDGTYTAAGAVNKAPAEWAQNAARKTYYRSALDAQLNSARPADALWPLLFTWTRSASLLAEEHPARLDWEDAMTQIGLVGEKAGAKLEALDAYLDQIEETLEAWGAARGVDLV